MRTRLALTVPALTLALLVSGCTGDDPKQSTSDLSKRLDAAEQAIADATSLQVSLKTDQVPAGVSGLKSATGVGNHEPAFQGKVSVVSGGASIGADVVATGGKVYAKTGFAPVYLTIKPSSLKAPDPAALVGKPGEGLATILGETKALKQGKRSRDGSDVLTTISGSLDGSIVQRYLETADRAGTFTVTYRLDEDDVLRDAKIRGPFYAGSPDVTYVVRLTPSKKSVTIEPPQRVGGR